MKKNWYKIFLVLLPILLPKMVSAATLYLTPATGSYGVGSTFTISVKTNTDGQAVNTAEANISYSATTLELVKVSQGSTFYLPAPGSPSKSGGSAYFGGGLPNPGYTGASGSVGSLTFRAKAEGEATINISSGKILLNDGFGTDALSGTSSAHFTITAPSATPTPTQTPTGSEVVVNSSSNPDTNKWYAVNTLVLSWSRPEGAYGFSFVLDQDPNTVPDNTLDTTITTIKTYPELAEGVYYFHIKARPQQASAAFGTVTTFKISIDKTPPSAFDIQLSGSTLNFAANDALSGIDHYDIFVDGSKYLSTTSSKADLEKLTGAHNIKITAVDKAGNTTEASLTIDLKPTNLLTRVIGIPAYVLLLLVLLILVLLAIIINLSKYRSRRAAPNIDLERVQEEIDQSLEDLKIQISKKLNSLNETSSEELFAAETEVAKDIRSGIVKTRKKIDDKLTRAKKKKPVGVPKPEPIE